MPRNSRALSEMLAKSSTTFIDRMFTTVQAAEMLGMAPGTLEKGRCTGGDYPPFTVIGRSIRYRESSLLKWLDSRSEFVTVAQAKAAELSRAAA